ncbi:c-type cytochrome domain-containing protein [Thalassoglobus polymorphus]|uniref:WD domain, G-beta repeat n=1 Tax=Thalassoglobus polymorphus TaxID=2527994 RepID=A0A517QLH3_9PLAN|nr:c-type cytochrome domain-containing protein [Thalassoglobus polymorphus]QDT32476.1 WD domain, G-beta repeat [Thalassoglobus polymorphus]
MKSIVAAFCVLCFVNAPAFSEADQATDQNTKQGSEQGTADAAGTVSYEKDVAPVFRKYCAGCHNDQESEGEFSLESYASLSKGTENGPAFLAKNPESSKIYRLMTGVADPKMPPEDEPAPTQEEIAKIQLWIEQGAKGPQGATPDPLALQVPTIESKTDRRPITAMDWSANGDARAIARYGEVEISRELITKFIDDDNKVREWLPVAKLNDFPGKVNSVHFCLGGSKVITSSGVAGLGGVATLWEWPLEKKLREFKGHRDIMFDAEVSPDGKILATCSYDKTILLWDIQTGEKRLELTGHNGAVYDLEFTPDSQLLVSASADSTCKVWRVSDGLRLDTLGQPHKEQYAVTISPDGRFVAAGGADNRIRVWQLISRKSPQINPILFSRFAHEGPIVNLSYTSDGKHLVSVAEDKTIKVWETKNYTETQLIKNQPEVAMAMAIAPDDKKFITGRLDGTVEVFEISKQKPEGKAPTTKEVISPKTPMPQTAPKTVMEQEPNQTAQTAQTVALPVAIQGVTHLADQKSDADCFKFSANAGEEWVFEVNAAQSKSDLDSFIDILTPEGEPVQRLILQAVRDSYFTFRGKTADQTTDFRIFNWKEMELNEYLYANGEVVKLWLYPRGPDSGFNVYPGTGKRWGYFDTTPLAHALGEPCYIVEPHPPGTELIPNGLPEFKVFYQNDDDAHRKLGKDSKLFFTAPQSGEYVVRLRDVRGINGENFKYTLTIRPRKPDFSVTLLDKSPTIAAGGTREIRLTADRLDNFEGPIEVNFTGVPEGYSVTSPITIEPGQISARGVIHASADAKPLASDAIKDLKVVATTQIDDRPLEHVIAGFTELKVDAKPKLSLEIVAAKEGAQPVNAPENGPLEFEIRPGETIMLQVNAKRLNFKGEISFGKEEAGRNLPHGVFVDNIGLNGLLLLSDQSQREFFITAANWVPEQSRLFHLTSPAAGGHATQPVMLHIRHDSRSSVTKTK